MKWLAWTSVVLIAVFLGYYYYDNAGKPHPPAVHEVHDGKGKIMSKSRDHEALWIHYSFKDAHGGDHEMSEKIPYIDLWQKLQVGEEVDILYDDEGVSVLKIVAAKRSQTNQQSTGE